ncbi:hypothetical protein WN51_04432 [Melipona quadrifasciata]|uniref:Uncharacterized protein n=1 Tax=Melipona quadrifasciata TaxID=166423 RepID=A0A0M8ZUR1_9HYME|nr:hypothetical protein WN51_04432 [Melipona quadrifasciata]
MVRWSLAPGSEGSRSPGIVIRSPLSSNRFQSVDFAGRPPPSRTEEVRQGVDGGRRTVGSLPRCRDQRIKGLKDNDLGWIEGCAVAGQIQPAFIAGHEEEEEKEKKKKKTKEEKQVARPARWCRPVGTKCERDDRTDSCELGHLFQFSGDFCMAQVMRARDHPSYALSSILGSYPQKPFRKLSAVSYEDLDSREERPSLA